VKSAKTAKYPLKFSGTISMAWAEVTLVNQPGNR
jgi:hypothetical protein